jgi:hypothetical protein
MDLNLTIHAPDVPSSYMHNLSISQDLARTLERGEEEEAT